MDDYSKSVIELLIIKNKEYLINILQNLGIEVANSSSLTTESVCALLEDRKNENRTFHKSSIYTCKCGSNLVIVRETQMRSADEGSTIIHLCRECGNMW